MRLSALLELRELLVDCLPEVFREFQLRQIGREEALLMLAGGGQPPQRAQFLAGIVVIGDGHDKLVTHIDPWPIERQRSLDGLTELLPSRLFRLRILFNPLGNAAFARHATAQPWAAVETPAPLCVTPDRRAGTRPVVLVDDEHPV